MGVRSSKPLIYSINQLYEVESKQFNSIIALYNKKYRLIQQVQFLQYQESYLRTLNKFWLSETDTINDVENDLRSLYGELDNIERELKKNNAKIDRPNK